MTTIKIKLESLDWGKVNNLIPAIVQDAYTMQVLMLGYMNKEACLKSLETGKLTFYSRVKQRLWTKGETSGNYLTLIDMIPDCDNDTLLVLVKPNGPSCHLNNPSCFDKEDIPGLGMLLKLETIIEQRYQDRPRDSYIAKLFDAGVRRIAQKVGEEGVEVALASVTGSKNDIKNEVADLLFHLLVLLKECRISLAEVIAVLSKRANHNE